MFLLFIFTGCYSTFTQHAEQSFRKTEDKIGQIKAQIDRKQKFKDEADIKIALLREKLFFHQIDLIDKKVQIFKSRERKYLGREITEKLFFEERKLLIEIIAGSEKYSDEAQLVLNDILEIITQLND